MAWPTWKNPSSPKIYLLDNPILVKIFLGQLPLNISLRRIKSAERKQDTRRILYRNSGEFPSVKFPLKISLPWNFPPHRKFSRWKIIRAENSPPPHTRKMYVCFPITNTIYKQGVNFITYKPFPRGLWGVVLSPKAELIGFSTILNKVDISKFWSDDFEIKRSGEGAQLPSNFFVT